MRRSFGSSRLRALAVAGLLASALWVVPAVHAQPPVSGPEFQVNVYTTYAQNRPDVSIDGNGAFVVVWTSEKEDGNLDGVFGRRYSSSGAAIGGEFQVDTETVGLQNEANVAVEPDGDFVVVWRTGADATAGEIRARRFSSAGLPQSTPFQVNTYTTDIQHVPAVAVDGDGDFVVVWASERQDGSNEDIEGRNAGVFAQRFDSAGLRLNEEFQVNIYTKHGQHDPVVAMRADGFFVITWASREQDQDDTDINSHDGIFARRYAFDGSPLEGEEFQVNTYTENYQHHQSIGMDAEGDFVIAWHSNQLGALPSALSDVWAQRFSSAGTPLGGEFLVNSYTPSFQEDTTIVMEEDGDFVVVWDSDTGDGIPGYGVFGKRFDSAGVAQSNDFQINTFTAGYQDRPAVTRSVNGTFVVAWQSSSAEDGYGYGVFARRFALAPPVPTLDVDANGSLGALTDGLLVLRWAFGFTGDTLINGAVGPGCVRCSADDIKAYLDSLTTTLDIDGNGTTAALTDGLLVLRRLFEFTGTTLTNGAVGGNCARCSPQDIESYLAGLMM